MNTRWKELKETYFSNIWDALMWLSLLLIVLWALAKAVGLINTPLIIEMAPMILMGFAAGKFFQEQKEFRKDMRRELTELSGRILRLELAKDKEKA